MGLYLPKPLSIVEAKRFPIFEGDRQSTDDVDAWVEECIALAVWCGGTFHAVPVLHDSDITLNTIYYENYLIMPGEWVVLTHRKGRQFMTFNNQDFVDTYIDLEVEA